MKCSLIVVVAFGVVSLSSATTPVAAQSSTTSGSGTASEAKAMLERAVQEVKRDEQKALTEFSRGEGGFRQRDLYVFCFGPDGKLDAHPNAALIGESAQTLSDKNGKHFALEMLKVAEEGKFAEVSYSWPRLLGSDPIPKTSYVTKVEDQVCGVGYYR